MSGLDEVEKDAMNRFCVLERRIVDETASAKRVRMGIQKKKDEAMAKLAEVLATVDGKAYKLVPEDVSHSLPKFVRVRTALNTRAITEKVIREAIESVTPAQVLEVLERGRNAPETVGEAIRKAVLSHVRALRTSTREYVDFCNAVPKGVGEAEIPSAPSSIHVVAVEAIKAKEEIKSVNDSLKKKLVPIREERKACADVVSTYMEREDKVSQRVQVNVHGSRLPFSIRKKDVVRRTPLNVGMLDNILESAISRAWRDDPPDVHNLEREWLTKQKQIVSHVFDQLAMIEPVVTQKVTLDACKDNKSNKSNKSNKNNKSNKSNKNKRKREDGEQEQEQEEDDGSEELQVEDNEEEVQSDTDDE